MVQSKNRTKNIIYGALLALTTCVIIPHSLSATETDGNAGEILMAPGLLNTQWNLTSMNKKAVRGAPNKPYLILKEEQMRVEGSGGCNRFSGSFKILGKDGIKFSGLVSTKMACRSSLATEQDFLKALASVDHFSFTRSGLLLLKEGRNVVLQFSLRGDY